MTRLATLTLLALVLTACGEQTAPTTTEPAATPSPSVSVPPRPTAVPAATGKVRGQATVLEADDGPRLCLGGVEESLPPQCSGPLLVGWRWRDVRGYFEQRSGVRWGSFVVTGTFDGTSLTVTDDPIPLALYDPMVEPPGEDPFRTRCPEPDGGWRVLDAELTTEATLQETLERATRLEGYGGAWVDQSVNPASDRAGDPEAEALLNDPRKLILDVLTTGDVAEAEATLRETWGGMLCVSPGRSTEAERRRIQGELGDLPGLLSSSAGLEQVEVAVVYDDGTFQRWADAAYGEGTVVVTSALEPVTP